MVAALISAFIIVSGVGVSLAADTAKPGDTLFSVDQAIEQARLKLAVSQSMRARLQLQVAEERERELAALQARESVHVDEAEREANQALDQAIQNLNTVRVSLEAKSNERAAEAVQEVEQKLEGLRETREEREQHQNASSVDEPRESEDDEQDDVNTNTTTNTNSSSGDGEDDDRGNVNAREQQRSEIRVEVKAEEGKTEIHTKVNGSEQEWDLATTDETTILLSIAARTGLTNAEIQAAWEYRVDSSNNRED